MKDEQRHGTTHRTQLSITMNFFHTFLDNFGNNASILKLTKRNYSLLAIFLFFLLISQMPHLKQLLFKTRKL
jgi:hypothetical protein